MRPILLPFLWSTFSLAGCGPDPERADMVGFWGRVVDGEHEVWELAYTLDVTGLEQVTPAFRWYNYPITAEPVEAVRGRWDVIRSTWVVTPSWGLDESVINRSVLRKVLDFDERQLEVEVEGQDEVEVYTTLTTLPRPRIAE
jgi:hypothetical protein